MTTAIAVKPGTVDAGVVERVLLHGDLRQLNPAQKVSYYNAVCQSVGLNPLTKPFEYIVLNGKEILYALRAATEQLRQIHAVSIQIVAREVMEDCYIVTARATLPTGRQDENIGAVPIAGLKGEARANAMMKAETKAKRRVTLAICGLGMLDETEVSSIPAQAPTAQPGRGAVPSVPNGGDSGASIDTDTGEERPAPPKGYFYATNYSLNNGWHEFDLLGSDANGGSLHLSTKKQIGYTVEQAIANGQPIKVTTASKKNARPGEAYLDTVIVWKPEPSADFDDHAEMVDESSIPF